MGIRPDAISLRHREGAPAIALLETPIEVAPERPFRGIRPFRYADHAIFFARTREIRRLASLVDVYRGVMLYGESGTGKSSLISAGLLPEMRALGYEPDRVRVQAVEGQELVIERTAITEDESKFLASIADLVDPEAARVVLSVAQFEECVAAASEATRPMLVFDQFEELLTLFDDTSLQHLRRPVSDLIVRLLHSELPVKLVLAFREDYLGRVKQMLGKCPELVDQALRLVPPSRAALPTIIRGPFEKFPGQFSHELTERLAERVNAELAEPFDRGELSLSELQTVCLRLWESPDPDRLFAARGARGIMEDYLGEELDALPKRLKQPAIAVLSKLVTSGGTRNIIAADDLMQRVRADQDLPAQPVKEALAALEAKSRLVRKERRRELEMYELTSEFLVPWIRRRQIEFARRRDRRRLLRVMGALLAIALILGGVAIWAFAEKNTAQDATNKAQSLGLASTADGLLDVRPDVSLVLALDAYRRTPSLEPVRASMFAALEAALRSGVYGILHGPANAVTDIAFDPSDGTLASASADGTVRFWDTATRRERAATLTVASGGVFSVAYSPDGHYLAAGGQDGTVWLSQVGRQSRLISTRRFGSSIIVSVAISRNGRYLAAVGLNDGITLVPIAPGAASGPSQRLADSSRIRSVAFSPDSRTLAGVGTDGRIRVWAVDAAHSRVVRQRRIAGVQLYAVAFSPAGQELAVGGNDGTVRVWRLASPSMVTLGGPGHVAINSVAFNPDGSLVAAAGADDTVQLWDARRGTPDGPPLTGHTGAVTSVAFSPDGRTLASSGTDRTVRLWHVPIPDGFGLTAQSGLGFVNSIAIAPDGSEVATGGAGGIRVWHTASGEASISASPPALTATGSIRAVAFGPTRQTLASGSVGGVVQLWNLSTGRSTDLARDPGDQLFSVALSRNGRLLAFAGTKGTIGVIDLATGHRLTIPPAGGRVFSLAFNRSGSILASGDDDRSIRLWDPTTGRAIRQLRGHSDAVFSVAFSPVGNILASGSADDTVRLWNVTEGTEIGQPLLGHHAYVWTVAFSPDGHTLASGSQDGTIRLWDVGTRAQVGDALATRTPMVRAVAFAPRGRLLVSGGSGRQVQFWPLAALTGDVRSEVCGYIGSGLSETEWKEFAGNYYYANPC